MRTEEQRKAIAEECARIEEKGGDVLAFLKSKGFIYTTQSVWQNMQKEILHRAPGKMTDGKPKEVADMNNREDIAHALQDDYYASGEEIRAFLEDCGYSNPSNGLASVKDWAKKHDPECYQAIKNLTIKGSQKRNPPEKAQNAIQTAAENSPGDSSRNRPETPDRPTQKETEAHRGGYVAPEEMAKELARRLGEKAGSVVTCCAPARPSGVTVPDEIPEESSNRQVKPDEPIKKKPRVTEVETDLGSFRKEEGKIAFRRVDDGKDYKNQLKMAREQWLQLAAEMDEVLEMLEEIDY